MTGEWGHPSPSSQSRRVAPVEVGSGSAVLLCQWLRETQCSRRRFPVSKAAWPQRSNSLTGQPPSTIFLGPVAETRPQQQTPASTADPSPAWSGLSKQPPIDIFFTVPCELISLYYLLLFCLVFPLSRMPWSPFLPIEILPILQGPMQISPLQRRVS